MCYTRSVAAGAMKFFTVRMRVDAVVEVQIGGDGPALSSRLAPAPGRSNWRYTPGGKRVGLLQTRGNNGDGCVNDRMQQTGTC